MPAASAPTQSSITPTNTTSYTASNHSTGE
jgi:hypothetical protein